MFKIIKFVAQYARNIGFLKDKKGTPSIEQVALIVFVALAIISQFDTITTAIGTAFESVGDGITDAVDEGLGE